MTELPARTQTFLNDVMTISGIAASIASLAIALQPRRH